MLFLRSRHIFTLVSRVTRWKLSRISLDSSAFSSLSLVQSRFLSAQTSTLINPKEGPTVAENAQNSAFELLDAAKKHRLNIMLMDPVDQKAYFDQLWAKLITG